MADKISGTNVGMTPCQKLLKQEGTARRIESMQQSPATPKNQRCREEIAEDCCMLSILLAVTCFNKFCHGVIPTFINPQHACTGGLRYLSCVCVCVCVSVTTLASTSLVFTLQVGYVWHSFRLYSIFNLWIFDKTFRSGMKKPIW